MQKRQCELDLWSYGLFISTFRPSDVMTEDLGLSDPTAIGGIDFFNISMGLVPLPLIWSFFGQKFEFFYNRDIQVCHYFAKVS